MPEEGALEPKDLQVLEYLTASWSKLFHLTTVQQGMLAVGQEPVHARRLRIGRYLLEHREIHPTVERWGARTVILTEEEKLPGRYLAQHAGDRWGRIAIAAAAAVLAQGERQVEQALGTLNQLGLIEVRRNGNTVDYRLAPAWRALIGPLGFTFHTVVREDGERFNVPCAHDFLLLAARELTDERLEIFDSCVHRVDRIHVQFAHGRITAVDPPETLIFRGGG